MSAPNADSVRPHLLRVVYEKGGWWSTTVDCPHEAMGADRPCHVWADDMGTEFEDACTFQQYADSCPADEWLHGRIEFAPVAIEAWGGGYEWYAGPSEAAQNDGSGSPGAQR